MVINGEKISRGESRYIEINVARLPSHSDININIYVSRAKEKGPVLLLMGGMHGDEINGTEIVRRMIQTGAATPDRGSVICIPILNIYGFIHFSRFVPDGKDVNRSFPGNRHGSLAARIANYLMKEIIPIIDYGVDFHTGGADRTNYPQIRCMLRDEVNADMARAFHAPFTLDSPYRPHSLRQAAARLGKRILVYEGGEASRFDQFAIKEGIAGTQRLMHRLRMRDEAGPEPEYTNLIIHRAGWIRAKKSGIFQTAVKYGQYVEKKEIVGYITDPFGESSTPIKSPAKGYIIGHNNNPLLHQGDAIIHLALLDDSNAGIEGM